MKKFIAILFVLILVAPAVFSQQENILSINVVPHGAVPLGASSTALFKMGAGAEVEAFFIPSFLKYFGLGIGGDFTVLPLETADSIRTLGFGAGPVINFPLGNRFGLNIFGNFGYYSWNPVGWDAGDGNGGDFYIKTGAAGTFKLSGPFSLGIGSSYDFMKNLYNGINFSLLLKMDVPVKSSSGTSFMPGGMQPQTLEDGRGIGLQEITLNQLFPVLYKYYDNNPVGTARVVNHEKKPVKDIKIKFYVERYMDNPMESGASFNLEPGEEAVINLLGLFTEDLMDITEGTKASTKITVSYTLDGQLYSAEYNPVLEFHNRNALVWDDDRKISSFITAKDPIVLSFSKNVMSWMHEVENPAVDENLQKAMALFKRDTDLRDTI